MCECVRICVYTYIYSILCIILFLCMYTHLNAIIYVYTIYNYTYINK